MDYCRLVGNEPAIFFSCALAGDINVNCQFTTSGAYTQGLLGPASSRGAPVVAGGPGSVLQPHVGTQADIGTNADINAQQCQQLTNIVRGVY